MKNDRRVVTLAFNPGPTKFIKAVRLGAPEATSFAVLENISLKFTHPATRAFGVSFNLDGDSHSLAIHENADGDTVAIYTSIAFSRTVIDHVDDYFGVGRQAPGGLDLDAVEAAMSMLEEHLPSTESLPLRRVLSEPASLDLLMHALDGLRLRPPAEDVEDTEPAHRPTAIGTPSPNRFEIARRLIGGGFPVRATARLVGAEPPDWKTAAEADATSERSLAEVFDILDERFAGRFMVMFRVWTNVAADGTSLAGLFEEGCPSVADIDRQLAFLGPQIERIEATIASATHAVRRSGHASMT